MIGGTDAGDDDAVVPPAGLVLCGAADFEPDEQAATARPQSEIAATASRLRSLVIHIPFPGGN